MNAPTTTQAPPQQQAAPQVPPAAVSKGQLVLQAKTDIEKMANEFKKTLPASVPTEKFVRTIQTAIQMNPDIAQCEKTSVINACMKAAADGLILDGREAVLNVYNVKKKINGQEKWVKEAVYIPMVTGIIKRVRQSGEVSRFNAFIRHENDYFKRTLGLEPTLVHEPNDDNPGKALGVYAVCLYKDGAVDYEYMTEGQVMNIAKGSKNAAQYQQDGGKNFEEWWRKTAIRRLSKRLPMDSDIRNVVQRVDEFFDIEADNVTVADASPGSADTATTDKPKRAYTRKGGAAGAKLDGQQGEEQQPLPLQGQGASNAPAASNQAATNGQAHTSHDPQTGEIMEAEYEDMEEGDPRGDGLEDVI